MVKPVADVSSIVEGFTCMNGLMTNNLRQLLLPFVLNPKLDINSKEQNSSSTAKPQVFSFRPKDVVKEKNDRGVINIFPTDRGQFAFDSSVSLLVSKALKDDNVAHGLTTLNTILNYIPGVQIREFTQDTRLEAVMSALRMFKSGASDGGGAAGEVGEFDDLKKKQLAFSGAYLTEYSKTDKFLNDLIDLVKDPGTGVNDYSYESFVNKCTIKLAHALYYRMVGSVTTNVYNIPNVQTQHMQSNGSQGWPNPNGLGISTTNNSWVGKLLNFVGGNMKIVTEPIWNAEFGGSGTSIDINLNLFNDTYEHAINNFLFVNTIVPQNMFLQYGLWQMPPSAYDIKIEGGMRYWMCKGNMTCNYKGVVRTPTKKMIDDLVKKHLNKNGINGNGMTAKNLIDNKIIRIPDVYELTMKFTSMLPDSFNQYLMSFAINNNIVSTAGNGNSPAMGDEVVEYITKLTDDAATKGESKVTDKNIGMSDVIGQGKKTAQEDGML